MASFIASCYAVFGLTSLGILGSSFLKGNGVVDLGERECGMEEEGGCSLDVLCERTIH